MSPLWIWAGAYFVGVTAALSLLLSRLSMGLARRWGVVDHPGERSVHREPTPLLGGVAVFGALAVMVWGHLFGAGFILANPDWLARVPKVFHNHLNGLEGEGSRLIVVFAGGLGMFLVGLLDDIKGLSVRARIYPQFLIALAVVLLGVRPSLAFLPEPLQVAVAVVWLVGITNAFNLVDGLDGLCSGLGAIASLILGTVMLIGNHPAAAVFFYSLGGACMGFLALNWHPARIFLGSAGSLSIGYFLGAMCMVGTFMSEDATGLFPLAIPVLVFAIPLYDTASVVLIRWMGKRSLFQGDQSHFHHRLMRIGFSVRQAVAFCCALAMAFGVGAMLITRAGGATLIMVLAQGIILIGVIVLMERVVGRVVHATAERRKSSALPVALRDGPVQAPQ